MCRRALASARNNLACSRSSPALASLSPARGTSPLPITHSPPNSLFYTNHCIFNNGSMTARTYAWRQARLLVSPIAGRRWVSQSTLDRLAKDPVQSYISTSNDPCVNLSIEHYLLQKSGPETVLLFLYVNRPSIIIGRNQNPWLEVNLALLDTARNRPETEPPGLGAVDLVRRRSGGGTVFHDEGNVNWTVICPPAQFTRDTHAEMVVRALRNLGMHRSRVNERHDIVLDQGKSGTATDPEDTHRTPYEITDGSIRPLKVSGSAYKLTRTRALHHGTCLLSSPNLNIIPDYLHSPAKSFITARGVESVSSPVGNISLSNSDFMHNVQEQFRLKYGDAAEPLEVGDDWLNHEPLRKGYDELKSLDWTYLQTPQFTITDTPETSKDKAMELSVKYGALVEGSFGKNTPSEQKVDLLDPERRIHEIESWDDALEPMLKKIDNTTRSKLTGWLEKMLPRGTKE